LVSAAGLGSNPLPAPLKIMGKVPVTSITYLISHLPALLMSHVNNFIGWISVTVSVKNEIRFNLTGCTCWSRAAGQLKQFEEHPNFV